MGVAKAFDRSVLIAAGLVIALLVVSAELTYQNAVQLLRDAQLVTHTREVLDLTTDVLLTIVDAETSERGFIITGKNEFLDVYRVL